MDIERDRVIEIVAAIGAVTAMIVAMTWVGSQYATDGSLTEEGGMMLVASVLFFVVLMAVVGVVLAHTVSAEDDDPNEEFAN